MACSSSMPGRAVDRGVACHMIIDVVGSHKWARGTLGRSGKRYPRVCAALPFRPLRTVRAVTCGTIASCSSSMARSVIPVRRTSFAAISTAASTASWSRVTGPAVVEMTAVFLTDWYLETEQLLDPEPAIRRVPASPSCKSCRAAPTIRSKASRPCSPGRSTARKNRCARHALLRADDSLISRTSNRGSFAASGPRDRLQNCRPADREPRRLPITTSS